MTKNIKKLFCKIFLLTLLVLISGTLVCIVVLLPYGKNNYSSTFNYFTSSLVNSELVYIMLSLAAFLIVVLFIFVRMSTKAIRPFIAAELKERRDRKRMKVSDSRFGALSRIDIAMAKYNEPKYNENITLNELCVLFRNFAANKLHLYYSEEDVRRFIAGLGVTKLMILQGMSGTGKTSLAYAMGRFLDNDSVIVPVQPMWKERSDMIGYFNEFTKRFSETTLLSKMYEAGYKNEMYITVLDEVNISRIEYYFAEFLSLLELPEQDKRYIDVVSDVWRGDPKKLVNGKILLPPNMWFIGTANNDDSTFAISDKVYDRAMVINLDRKCAPFHAPETGSVKISHAHWCRLIENAKVEFSLSEECRVKVQEIDSFLTEKFHISFGNRIMKQIEEYVSIMIACGGSEIDALDDILAGKVLRKLDQQNPAYVKKEMAALEEMLERQFGTENLPLCNEYIHGARWQYA